MRSATDYAFDIPILVPAFPETIIRTVAQATSVLHSNMRELFTIEALNVLLMLERAAEGDEVEEARLAFYSWASRRGLVASASTGLRSSD
jgi:hypothetical protein